MIGEIEGIKIYVNDETYTKYKKTLEDEIDKLQQENKILKENAENNDKVVDKVNWENMLLKKENKQLKEDISFCLHSIKQEMEMSEEQTHSLLLVNYWL